MQQISIDTAFGALGRTGGVLSTGLRLTGRGVEISGGAALLSGLAGPSPNDSVVVPGGPVASFTDNQLNVWTITAAGTIAINGLVDSVTHGVVELAWVNGVIWQLNNLGNWYWKTSLAAPWQGSTRISPLPGAGAVLMGTGSFGDGNGATLTTGVIMTGHAFSDSFSAAFG